MYCRRLWIAADRPQKDDVKQREKDREIEELHDERPVDREEAIRYYFTSAVMIAGTLPRRGECRRPADGDESGNASSTPTPKNMNRKILGRASG